jgi:putative pyruvate formate lyase activating enzyme
VPVLAIPSINLDSYKNCELCARRCQIDRTGGSLGVCGASTELRIARIALHFWEEPPISGNNGSGCVFFSHCNLGCVYCQNRKISGRKDTTGRIYTINDLAAATLDLQNQGALNINFVTPTHYAPSVRQSIAAARTMGLDLPTVWNCGGYENPVDIQLNREFVDIYLSDFKYADPSLAKQLSNAVDYPNVALNTIDTMFKQTGLPQFDEYQNQTRLTHGIVVRHMVLPGHIDNSKQALKVLFERYGDTVLYSIMNQYTPTLASDAKQGDTNAAKVLEAHPELARTVTDEEYEEVLDFADALGMQNYFWQSGETQNESFIPDFE